MSASSDELLMPSDIEMATPEMVSTTRASVEIASTTRASAEDGEGESGVSSHQGELGAEDALARVTYIDYLKSPIITLLVGQADDQAILSAHQALLMTSPWFAEACAKFDDDLLERRIDLVDADLETMGCVLEFLYTGDYFPHQLPNTQDLESDPSIPKLDETGDQLLKHARVYTLAETFVLPALRSLAFSKIHCVDSTSKGEIAYARYVYAHTNKDDHTIRAPVAKYWATQSLNLRTEAEVDPEFKQLCLDLPQFGYDVLTRILEEKSKREKQEKVPVAPIISRKRTRGI